MATMKQIEDAIAEIHLRAVEPLHPTAGEWRAYPRVKVVWGKAHHFYGWEAKIMWSRRPREEVREGESVYMRMLGIEVRAGLWCYLRGVVRVRDERYHYPKLKERGDGADTQSGH
jgi:hypothetical protein